MYGQWFILIRFQLKDLDTKRVFKIEYNRVIIIISTRIEIIYMLYHRKDKLY